MTTFKAYGPQRKINFPTTGLYEGRIYMDQYNDCWEFRVAEDDANKCLWVKLWKRGVIGLMGKTRYGFEVNWWPKIVDMFFFKGTMYIYEKVGNSKPDWFIYDKTK